MTDYKNAKCKCGCPVFRDDWEYEWAIKNDCAKDMVKFFKNNTCVNHGIAEMKAGNIS